MELAVDLDHPSMDHPCPNVYFCECVDIPGYLDYCMGCLSHGWKSLSFRDTMEPCAVCLENKGREMRFPACNHWFCTDCSRNILLWDETRYHIDPVPFGCPPCNHAVNGAKSCNSRPCTENDDNIVDAWKDRYPENGEAWILAEDISVENSHSGNTCDSSAFSSKVCPLCREVCCNTSTWPSLSY